MDWIILGGQNDFVTFAGRIHNGDMIPSSRTQKYKNLLGGILCPEKVKLMQ